MEEKGKYTVGTDKDTADTVRTSVIRETALYLARVYKKTYYPKPLDLDFEVDEVVVEIRVRAKDATQPKRRAGDREISSERAQDA
jgi:hypothetical protein